MQALFEWDKTSQAMCKGRVRNLLIKIMKKIDAEQLEKLIPAEHLSLLKNLQKQERKNERLKKTRIFDDNESMDDKEQLYKNADKIKEEPGTKKQVNRRKKVEDLDFELEDIDDLQMTNPYKIRVEEKPEQKNILLKFDENNETFHFIDGPTLSMQSNKIQQQSRIDEEANKDELVYFDEKSGRLIIKEQERKQIGFKRRRQQMDDEGAADNSDIHTRKKIKEDKSTTLSQRLLAKHNTKNNEFVHSIRETGDSYKVKDGKTQGDVMIPGKAQPHAFIQFNPIALQKKHMGKASLAFESITGKKKTKGQ